MILLTRIIITLLSYLMGVLGIYAIFYTSQWYLGLPAFLVSYWGFMKAFERGH